MDGPASLEQGRAAFNRGEYFRAHELWEAVWLELEGAERVPVQGLIQIAAGLHHLQQGRPRPAAGLLRKGREKIQPHPLVMNLHVDDLVRGVGRLLAELETAGAAVSDPGALRL
jgi:predicted metal-dependent hydrolase